MILDARNGDRGRVFDADGNQVKNVLRVNTETGTVQTFDTDTNGITRVENDEAVILYGVRPAPLIVIDLDNPNRRIA